MKNLFLLSLVLLPLAGCSASIGTPPVATTTTYATPAVSSTTYATPPVRTTVTRTY